MMFAGIGAFLTGMKLCSLNLEAVAGGRVEKLFTKLSDRKLAGVGIGVGSAAVLQSSSATTVILLGLVNSGIVSLFQATCIIMGANIGTTFTALIISLNYLPISELFAFMTFIGMMTVMAAKRSRVRTAGWILTSIGLIFIGLEIIKAGAVNLKSNEIFLNLFSGMTSPLLLLTVGVAFTAVIQSSSAVTGIVITLAQLGIMPVTATFYIIMGSNVGSCATAMLAAIGGSLNARRTAMIHLLFNAIGVILFLPFVIIFGKKTVDALNVFSPSVIIAYFHIAFNLVTTLVLLPFVKALANLACLMVGDKQTNACNQDKNVVQ